jgi:amino acid adenylation domain-containing protein
MRLLQDLVTEAAIRAPEALAIRAPDGEMTYGEFDRLANQVARALLELGVCPGDRVALWTEKSTKSLIAMQAVLRIGAAYVPIDPQSPCLRSRKIIENCKVAAVITSRSRAEELLIGDLADIPCLSTDGSWQGFGWDSLRVFSDDELPPSDSTENDLAYILYTSGSTGQPKGVSISHLNALAFIDWAVETIQASSRDRFANHAPFHFDLSVLDLYAAFSVGASVHVISEKVAYLPKQMIDFIQNERISIWYSVPSAVILMMEHGGLLDIPELPLRVLLFAGEPFAVKHLRNVRDRWSNLRLLNLYGPTETNVCTYYEVKQIHEKRTTPVPIGKATCGDKVWLMKVDGSVATIPGEEGELFVSGPTVMLGYWGQPPQGEKPYGTGDIVRIEDDGNFVYIGRRDHLVKVRGHRVELGDIESALLELAQVREASVIVKGSGLEARLVAFLVCSGDKPPTLLEIKRHCSKRLPHYMIVDEVKRIEAAPRTTTGKVDKNILKEMILESPLVDPKKKAA